MSSTSSSTLEISWIAQTGATSYQVFRDTSSTGPFTVKVFDDVGTSFTDDGLDTGGIYWYKVQASNGSGVSALSSAVSGSPGTVYTAGFYNDGTKDIPSTWTTKITGTTLATLDNSGRNAYATSAFVSGGSVYSSGYYNDGAKNIPCYWTGISKQDLPGDGTHDAFAYSVYVFGGTVYTAGKYNNSSINIPCYWAGTAKQDLAGDGTHSATAISIFVSGSTAYTAGYYADASKFVPCYWAGIARQDLAGDGTHSALAAAIFVSGGTVYTAGYYYDGSKRIPCYWAGTTRTPLPGGTNNAEATSLFVSGGTVYTAGYYNDGTKNIPCYWTGTAGLLFRETARTTRKRRHSLFPAAPCLRADFTMMLPRASRATGREQRELTSPGTARITLLSLRSPCDKRQLRLNGGGSRRAASVAFRCSTAMTVREKGSARQSTSGWKGPA